MIASVIMSARTRQFGIQFKNRSSPQLHTMYATKEIYARSHRDVVVERLELTLVAGVVRGSGLGLGCGCFGRHIDELISCIELIRRWMRMD
jgi:hypothetical protein